MKITEETLDAVSGVHFFTHYFEFITHKKLTVEQWTNINNNINKLIQENEERTEDH